MTARFGRWFCAGSCLLALAVALVATAAPARAQVPVVGTADFRNAPILPPGQFLDQIVTGESVWYSLIYTNRTPYRFEVSLPGVDLDSNDELTLEASFIGPTFEPIGRSGTVVEGSGAEYPSSHTNIWFLRVTLSSTGEQNLAYDVLIDIVEGVQNAGLENCADLPGCTLDADLRSAQAEFDEVKVQFDEFNSLEQQADVESEISNLTGFYESSESLRPAVEARLSRLEAQLGDLCAPEATCTTFPDPPAKASTLGLGIGSLAVLAGVARAIAKFRAPEKPPTPPRSTKPPVKKKVPDPKKAAKDAKKKHR